MPTLTKPVDTSPESKIKRARSAATKAINKSAQILADPSIGSRSTATRSAFKIKAEALDDIALILAGKK